MFSELFKDKKANVRRGIILLIGIGFFTFLYFFNQVDKVQLVNKEGTSFEKAVVEEIIMDNKGSDDNRQEVKLKILSGKYKGRVVNATSFSGYLYGAECKVNRKVIVSLSISGDTYVASVYSNYREPLIYGFVGLFLLIISFNY